MSVKEEQLQTKLNHYLRDLSLRLYTDEELIDRSRILLEYMMGTLDIRIPVFSELLLI